MTKHVKAAKEWGEKALAASQRADTLRTCGDIAEADKFDNLAEVAPERQLASERQTASAEPTIKTVRGLRVSCVVEG